MSSPLSNSRIAYVIHAALSVLVLGLLAWATVASLRLERAAQSEARARAMREHERSVQLAVYQIENLAGAMLSGEMLRPASDYTPLYYPGTDEVRIGTGEMLRPGYLVKPSPLLLRPPENPWILLHFQASPRGGYDSPQLVPERARDWPDFNDVYDAAARERFANTLAQLRYAYTVDELARKYEEAGGVTLPDPSPGVTAGASTQTAPFGPSQAPPSEYNRRKQSVNLMNRLEQRQAECTPQQLAVAQLHAEAVPAANEFANDPIAPDDEVGVQFQTMLPVWLRIPNQETPVLAFLRAALADQEAAFQGFLVDWRTFRDQLLCQVADRFPDAELRILDPPPSADTTSAEDTVLGVIPAQFVPNVDPPQLAAGTWSGTHTMLLAGWIGSVLLLVLGALGIRSLVSLTERRTQFAYAVTHELRTPLTTFRLYTDMLAQGLVNDADRQGYLDTLNQESRRLADLVSGVLEYSRVENDRVPLNRQPCRIGDVLDAVRDDCAPRCEPAEVRLEIEPNGTADTIIDTDRHHVMQIIGNLVDNACKYGRDPDDPVVRIEAHEGNGQLHFDVIDHGPGVPARLRNTIFEPYQRGDVESVPATGGIGLGLALSKSWAKLLGGQLELLGNARSPRGARFRLSLPLT
jgi:signal transduction histidine kinase